MVGVKFVTQRFIECYNELKNSGKVRSARSFALSVNYLPQNFASILKGVRDVPMELLQNAMAKYRFNPNFIFLGEGGMFLDEYGKDEFKVLTVVCDGDQNEKIVHVDTPAQAGYATEYLEPSYITGLPTYNIPGYDLKHGTFRSFDVFGDSMEPNLFHDDKVVCQFVEPNYWLTSIKDDQVYVIVTRDMVVVKRVNNNLQRHRHLALISDNEAYQPYRVNVSDIKEIWHVRSVIRQFDHHYKKECQISAMQETLDKQAEMLSMLMNKMEANA